MVQACPPEAEYQTIASPHSFCFNTTNNFSVHDNGDRQQPDVQRPGPRLLRADEVHADEAGLPLQILRLPSKYTQTLPSAVAVRTPNSRSSSCWLGCVHSTRFRTPEKRNLPCWAWWRWPSRCRPLASTKSG